MRAATLERRPDGRGRLRAEVLSDEMDVRARGAGRGEGARRRQRRPEGSARSAVVPVWLGDAGAHLALEAPEHFGGDDVDALFGADIALAKWEDPSDGPGVAGVLRASGLDEAERRAADARLTGTREKKPTPWTGRSPRRRSRASDV